MLGQILRVGLYELIELKMPPHAVLNEASTLTAIAPDTNSELQLENLDVALLGSLKSHPGCSEMDGVGLLNLVTHPHSVWSYSSLQDL